MRVVFMGTPDFAVPTLRRLVESGHEVVCVVTQPDKPVGRKRLLTPSPVKEAALELGLSVLQPSSVNKREFRDHLKSLGADVAVVLAFGQIFRKALLGSFPHGCINVHGSILPKYRGAAPIQRAVMDGETVTGITIMRMDEGLDTGPVLLARTLPIGADETSGELFLRVAELGADAMADALGLLEAGLGTFSPQPDEEWSYAAKLTEEEARIDWAQCAVLIHNRVRGLNPAPGASALLEDASVKVWRTRLLGSPVPAPEGIATSPGTIVGVAKSGIAVQTGCGLVEICEIQPAGGRRMGAGEFARGKRLSPGVAFQAPNSAPSTSTEGW